MSAAAIIERTRPAPLEVFEARCEARAVLYAAGEITLHDAVDELQAAAIDTGVVAEIGQDAVQAHDRSVRGVPAMKPDDEYEGLSSTFAQACREADAQLKQQAQAKRPAPAKPPTTRVAASTLMAAEFLVRLDNPERLRKWLAEHSAEEREAIRQHLYQYLERRAATEKQR